MIKPAIDRAGVVLTAAENFSVPALITPDIAALHKQLQRYAFAADWINRVCSDMDTASVVDIGCGTGIGCDFLGSLAFAGLGGPTLRPRVSVVGVDVSAEAIEEARTYRARENVSYVHEDAEAFLTGFLPSGQASTHRASAADVVLSFETLEHLDNIAVCTRLAVGLARRLCIFSVPYKEKPGWNPYHKHFGLDCAWYMRTCPAPNNMSMSFYAQIRGNASSVVPFLDADDDDIQGLIAVFWA